MTITLNMIVGPFNEPFLQAAVESSVGLCDEFIFIDTAPGNNPNRKFLNIFQNRMNYVFEDLTFDKLAPKDPPIVKIIDMPRGKDKDFNYSIARELARKSTESEWVLRLDADEIIHEKYIDQLKDYVTNTKNVDAIKLRFWHHYLHPNLILLLHGQDTYKQYSFIRTNSFKWINQVHEIPSIISKPFSCPEDIKYNHYGYCRGQKAIKDRWVFYDKLGGLGKNSLDVENIDDNIFLETIIDTSVLVDYTDVHPPVVIPKLEELFPGSKFK